MLRAQRAGAFALGVSLLFAVSGCCSKAPTEVVIPTANQRFDHNRGVEITEWTFGATTTTLPPLDKLEALGPLTPLSLPHSGDAVDRLPAARLHAVHSGVLLPLSDAERAGAERSDHDDLVDFLRSGPLAKAGIAPGTPAEPIELVLQRYGDVLRMLASESDLANRDGVLAWAEAHDAPITFRIRDARFVAEGWADRVALRVGDYWFVLFAVPRRDAFTRVVVVPAPTPGQDFDGKRPDGGPR